MLTALSEEDYVSSPGIRWSGLSVKRTASVVRALP